MATELTRPTKINRLNDSLVKYIFARDEHKELVLSLINAVFESKKMRQLVDFTFASVEINPEHMGGKGSRLDILGTCSDGTTVNIEVQVKRLADMVERSVYYMTRLFPQIHKGDSYSKLKQTICIDILAHSEFPEDIAPSYVNCFLLQNKDVPGHILTDILQIYFIELDKFAKTFPDVDKMSLIDKWCAYLSPATPKDTLDTIAKTEPVIQKALDAEEKFMGTAELLAVYYDEEKAWRDQDARERFLLSEERKEIAKNLLLNGMTRDFVAKNTALSIEEVDAIVENIKQ